MQNEIFQLHKEFGKTEWSGVLLVKKLKGTIETNDLEFQANHVILLHKGEPTFTSIDATKPEVQDIMFTASEKYEDYEEYKWGLMHTHQFGALT